MSCRRKSCEPLCFYCEEQIEGRHEHDHVFGAKRHGGEASVAVCMGCHNLKDRVPFRHWNLALQVQAFRECGPLGRILVAKALDLAADSRALLEDPQSPAPLTPAGHLLPLGGVRASEGCGSTGTT